MKNWARALGLLIASVSLIVPMLATAAPPDWGKAGQGQDTGEGAPTKQPGQRPTPPAPGKKPWEGGSTRRILPPAPGPGPTGTAVLKLFWHAERNDYLTTATDAGAAEAQRAGYELVGWVGYVFTDAHAPCTAPLKLYRHPQQQDHVTVVSGASAPSAEESGMLKAGYQFVRIEGHVLNLGGTDCARNAAVKKQLTDLAGTRPIADLKLFNRGNDYLTISDSFKGRMDPEHNLRSYRFVSKAGAVYGFPPPPPAAPSAQGMAKVLNVDPNPPVKEYGPIAVCGHTFWSRSYITDDPAKCVVATGIRVRAGSTVELRTDGRVNFGGTVLGMGAPELDADGDHWQAPQDYPAPALRKNSLIAKVGGSYYQGGMQKTLTVKEEGELILMANDRDLKDNRGKCQQSDYIEPCGWQVRVKVTEPASSGSGGTPPSGGTSQGGQTTTTEVCYTPPHINPAYEVCVTRTNLQVRAGSRVDIVATGKVNFGGAVLGMGAPELDADGDHLQAPPDYPAPALRKNSLIARIGSKYYQGGTRTNFTADEDGQLVLMANDKNLSDNRGIYDPGNNRFGWQVTVTITPPGR